MSDTQAWEVILERAGEILERIAVPGGWIYRTSVIHYSERTSRLAIDMVFVPRVDRVSASMLFDQAKE